MRLSRIFGCLAAAAAMAGCGGSDPPETLTCAWLEGPDNCWSNTALMAESCLPPDNDSGTFSADNSTCTYPGGSSVSFTPPLVLPLPDEAPWNFTVNGTNGQACLHYEENAAGIKLTVGGQTVTDSFVGIGMAVTCPDGTKVQTANAINLLGCPAGLNALPGHFIGYTDTSVSFALVGTTASSFPVFECSR